MYCASLNYILQISGKTDDDLEKLRPEELNQQNIEALLAESNMVNFIIYDFKEAILHQIFLQKMEILPVNDLDIALHDFVNKDDKMAFYSCLQHTLEDTRVRIFIYLLICIRIRFQLCEENY